MNRFQQYLDSDLYKNYGAQTDYWKYFSGQMNITIENNQLLIGGGGNQFNPKKKSVFHKLNRVKELLSSDRETLKNIVKASWIPYKYWV